MILDTTTVTAADAYWASFFGISLTDLDEPGTRVVPHAELGDYRGIFCFRRGETLIVSVPSDLPAVDGVQLASLTPGDLDRPDVIATRISQPIERMVGPAYIGYTDAGALRPRPHPAVRLLNAEDADALSELRAACSPEDWTHGGSEPLGEPLAGAFYGPLLVALAGYERWGEQIAHLAVITRPDARGRGYGTPVVSLASEAALARGLVPQYRTLYANAPSMAIAESLGFLAYADTVALRLAEPPRRQDTTT